MFRDVSVEDGRGGYPSSRGPHHRRVKSSVIRHQQESTTWTKKNPTIPNATAAVSQLAGVAAVAAASKTQRHKS